MTRLPAFLVSLPLIITPAAAEVTAAGPNGFDTAHTVTVTADAATVWQALLSPANWWNGAHSWSGDAAHFSLDPVPGGCFCEIWDGGQVRHLEVVSLIESRQLVLRGGLGPLQDRGVAGALSWTLAEAEDGSTSITVTYRVGGFIAEGMEGWSGPVDGVITEQADRLAAYLNTGSPDTE